MGIPNVFDHALSSVFVQLQTRLKLQLKRFENDSKGINSLTSSSSKYIGQWSYTPVDLERQLQAWRENPLWHDEFPEINVSSSEGSLCKLNVEMKVGLPPDAVYNIATNPNNKRVFRTIKELISREVVVDEGLRQVVETKQAAFWKFLWWSGTMQIHLLVDQNREDYSMKYKQVKSGIMRKFEGCWLVEPVFVDEQKCFPFKPKTLDEYCSCTRGKGRVGSKVTMYQLTEPAINPPPPISYYLRGITAKSTKMMINDLFAETARIRGGFDTIKSTDEPEEVSKNVTNDYRIDIYAKIKERWALRRSNARRCNRRRS